MPELFIIGDVDNLPYVLARYEEKTGTRATYVQARRETLDELDTDLRKEIGKQPKGHILLGGHEGQNKS